MKDSLLIVLVGLWTLAQPIIGRDPIALAQRPDPLVDARGQVLDPATSPERIVVAGRGSLLLTGAIYLFPEAAERVVALPRGGQGIAGEFFRVVDPQFDTKVLLDNAVGPEQMIALQPDRVILKSYMFEDLGQSLAVIDLPVTYLELETPEQYVEELRILGSLFQNPERAEVLIDFYQDQIDRTEQIVQAIPAEEYPSVLVLYYNDRDGQVAFNVPPLNWIQTTLVERAGGRPAWDDAVLGQGWTTVNLEQIAAWDPDFIFVIHYTGDPEEVAANLYQSPAWQAIRATQNQQLRAFPKDYFSWDQPDPRWILGLKWLATQLHPDWFSELDMITETQTFFEFAYGLDPEVFEQSIQPNLRGLE